MFKKLTLSDVVWYTEKLIPYGRIGDKIFAYYLFFRCHKRFPKNEMLFNDVLFRFKVSNRILNPACTFTTDKEFVKLYIKSKVGDKYNVPTLAILHTEDEISKYDYPSDCVIKPTHSSQRHIMRKNGAKVDRNEIRSWLKHNYYYGSREANYRYLTPKIIIEPLLFNGVLVNDYKLFCFNGRAKCIMFCSDHFGDHPFIIFLDPDWNFLQIQSSKPIQLGSYETHVVPEKPQNLSEMIKVAEKLSEPFDLVRVDMYSGDGFIYVGELTHCHMSAKLHYSSKDEILLSETIFNDSKYSPKT